MLPVIYFSPTLYVPTFFAVISLVLCLGLFWLDQRVRTHGLDRRVALDAALLVMLSSLLGSRLFHVIYENPEYYWQNPVAVFFFWNGGFVFYGGALLSMAAGYFFIKKKEPRKLWRYFDLFTPICSMAYAVGRLGCFLTGCCFGRLCDLPWAVDGRHPTQLYASFWEWGVLLILLGSEKRSQKPGQLFLLWLVLHSLGRILMESFRDDFRGPAWGLSVSTWISLIIALGAGFTFLRRRN